MKIIEEYINPCRSRYVKQYNDMPECFKSIFALDEKGNSYSIRDLEEVEQS